MALPPLPSVTGRGRLHSWVARDRAMPVHRSIALPLSPRSHPTTEHCSSASYLRRGGRGGKCVFASLRKGSCHLIRNGRPREPAAGCETEGTSVRRFVSYSIYQAALVPPGALTPLSYAPSSCPRGGHGSPFLTRVSFHRARSAGRSSASRWRLTHSWASCTGGYPKLAQAVWRRSLVTVASRPARAGR